jgi:hypothetical protein
MDQPLRIGPVGAGMVSRHHLIAWASLSDQARVVAIADPLALRDDTPFETAPQDNLETLRLVEDCYRLAGWEASR